MSGSQGSGDFAWRHGTPLDAMKGGIQRKTHKRAARQEFEDACLERSLPVLGEEDYDPEEPNLDDPYYQDLEEENVRRAMSVNKQTLEIDEDRRRQMFRGASSSGHAAEHQGRTQRRRRETVDLNPQPQIPPPFRRSQRGSGPRVIITAPTTTPWPSSRHPL
ncbi:hypothetical protein NE237_030615 [Protea cynaroides]|uniref:Uncharacterized protein n=1 Tax=Protea cynaroides TaxID=273540 RepID=A0A9Q0GWA6_9MAGN|nr:hypothetical protein NE237_030615 [Protea cynaroides]